MVSPSEFYGDTACTMKVTGTLCERGIIDAFLDDHGNVRTGNRYAADDANRRIAYLRVVSSPPPGDG